MGINVCERFVNEQLYVLVCDKRNTILTKRQEGKYPLKTDGY